MSTAKLLILSLILIVAGGVLYAYGTTLRDTRKEVDFEESGVLVINNPGMEEGVWHLLYESEGAPALGTKLYFRETSECRNEEEREISCIEDFTPQAGLEHGEGQHVVVEGRVFSDGILVSKLSYVKEPKKQAVKLYYYNPDNDVDDEGNLLCSREGLVPVGRDIEEGEGLEERIQNTVAVLLQGELSEEERASGLITEFPLEGLGILDADISGETLTLTFADPNSATSGGSCRVGILWFQIEKTAVQFEGIEEVRFSPEELFQP